MEALLMRRLSLFLGLAIALAAGSDVVQAQQNIGIAASVKDQVTGNVGTQQRTLARGDQVFQNEVIATNAVSSSQLLFLDETALTVGPNSNVTLDTFVYDPNPANSKVTLTIGKGVARFVTGVMQSSSYEIRTPVAVIGVRGTIVDIWVSLSYVVVVVRDGIADVRSRVNNSVTPVGKGGALTIGATGAVTSGSTAEANRAFGTLPQSTAVANAASQSPPPPAQPNRGADQNTTNNDLTVNQQTVVGRNGQFQGFGVGTGGTTSCSVFTGVLFC
jgi:hypothetical protein